MIDLYNTMYQLPIETIQPQYDLIIPASIMALAFGILAGYNAAKHELRLAPAESMRPKAPKAGQKTLFEKMNVVWQRFSFSWKIIIRNLFRYKKRIAFTTVGMILSTALLLTALGLNDSLNYMMEQQFSKIQHYDLKVNLDKMVNLDELSYFNNLAHIVKMEPVMEMGIELRHDWYTKKMGITVFISDSDLYRLSDPGGTRVHLPDQGILLPEKLSRILLLKSANMQ
jgi:putative ABC transport system permease protein